MVQFINVPDMTCGASAHRIGHAIAEGQLPEGVTVEVDVTNRQVSQAAHAGDTVIGLVHAAIERAGYTANAAQAVPPRPTSGHCCCGPRRSTTVDIDQHGVVHTPSCCS